MQPTVKRIDIGLDFSPTPGGRYRSMGPFSAQQFREEHLLPALRDYDQVVVAMDSASGYGAGWLEEVFGGAVRELGFVFVDTRLQFEAVDRAYLVPRIQLEMQAEAAKVI